MHRFFLKVLILTVVIYGTAELTNLITVENWLTAFFAALALALVNLIVRPLLFIITLPVTCLTLGLFLLLINGLMLMTAAFFVPGFTTGGWLNATIAALVITVVSHALQYLLDPKKSGK